MVTKWGADHCPLLRCNFAKDLRMDAKARKREKRRAEREALRTTTTGQAAQDAEAAAQDADVWGEPYARPQPDETPPSSAAEEEDFEQYIRDCLPTSFAACVTQLLVKSGLAPLDDKESCMLYNTLVHRILPAMQQQVRERRQVAQQRDLETDTLGSQGGTSREGAGTQSTVAASQIGLQQGAAGCDRGLHDGHGSHEAGTAKGPADEEPKALWEAALRKAKLEGGDSSVVKANAVKMYRGMKRKQKAQEKKLIVVA